MSPFRVLIASIAASFFILQARAQSPAAPVAPSAASATLQIPALSATPPLFVANAAPTAPLFRIPRPAHIEIIPASGNSPCYTLRTYGYTERDLRSASPTPSSYTTCTPTSSSSLKNALATPAK